LASSPLAIRRNKWIFLACWLLWTVVHSLMLRNFGLNWDIIVADSVGSNALLSAASLLIIHTLGFYRPEKRKYIYLLVWCLVISVIWAAVVKLILVNVFPGNDAYTSFVLKSMPLRFDLAFLITGCTAITSNMWYDLQEKKMNESMKADAEKLARDAELYKLRQQLNPHFLFNSLNSISALAGNHPEQARKMIHQLSEFLRGALKKEDHQLISLSEELQHLGLYLEMEKVRFGHRLATEIQHDDRSGSFLIPPMLLQPIVENAIKFGLYDTIEDVTIRIEASATDEFLNVRVENPFDRDTAVPRQGTGFGLNSVKRRLFLLFGRNDLLTVTTKENLFITIVKIPVHDKDSSN
jgi:two-component system LytT family sensor kinase